MKLTVNQAVRNAATLALKGKKDDAERIYRQILQRFPNCQPAILGLQALAPRPREDPPQGEIERLIAIYNGEHFLDALSGASALLQRYPTAPLLHSIAGAAAARLGRFEQALASFDTLVGLAPDDANARCNRGNVLHSLQRLDEAIVSYEAAIERDPCAVDTYVSRGNCFKDLGQFAEALDNYEKALSLKSDLPLVWYNRGNILLGLDRPAEALDSYEKTIALTSDFAQAHNNRGNLLREFGRLDEALTAFDKAIQCKPDLGSAHNNRAVLLKDMRRLEEALAASELAVQFEPDFNAYSNRGAILSELKRFDEALLSFDRAVRLKPDAAAAYINAGNALQDLGRLEEAILCYDAAISVNPGSVDAHGNRGNAMGKLDQPVDAIASYAEALRLKPDLAPARAQMLYHKAHICDWTEPAQSAEIANLGVTGDAIAPFTMLALDDHPGRQLARARLWTRTKLPAAAPPLPRPEARPAKLRIGYFSADYHDHATMLLMIRLFEAHDRERFELHAFSYGPDKQDWMQKRAEAAFDHFHDVRHLHDPAVAGLARDLAIDVAVDLKGYTRDTRSSIFAYRPAPVQMSYLGYPGSMGAGFIDYIVADRVVLPPENLEFYSEKAITLPHSYQANDNGRVISDRIFTRAELGLPENAFVFCCFNNSYKISPAEFDIWMRLLGKVEGSVLWLLEGNRYAKANLCRESEVRGVDPARLVFAPRIASPEHLARHRCADLFLDTFNYNAHTTGSDALWAGLPIVTRLGQSFASRVGASLLEATGMGELVTHSAARYEQLALALASDPTLLAKVRTKLAAQLPDAPLYDSQAFARDIERAFDIAFARRVAGLPPDHIDLVAEGA